MKIHHVLVNIIFNRGSSLMSSVNSNEEPRSLFFWDIETEVSESFTSVLHRPSLSKHYCISLSCIPSLCSVRETIVIPFFCDKAQKLAFYSCCYSNYTRGQLGNSSMQILRGIFGLALSLIKDVKVNVGKVTQLKCSNINMFRRDEGPSRIFGGSRTHPCTVRIRTVRCCSTDFFLFVNT